MNTRRRQVAARDGGAIEGRGGGEAQRGAAEALVLEALRSGMLLRQEMAKVSRGPRLPRLPPALDSL